MQVKCYYCNDFGVWLVYESYSNLTQDIVRLLIFIRQRHWPTLQLTSNQKRHLIERQFSF
jgi:hypothetical protein